MNKKALAPVAPLVYVEFKYHGYYCNRVFATHAFATQFILALLKDGVEFSVHSTDSED